MDNFNKIINATKASEIKVIINSLEEQGAIEWRPVGDNESNCGTIEINKDPISGKVERETNGIDSILELDYQNNSKTLQGQNINSPRKLVEKIYGIKDGRLENVNSDQLLREMAKKVSIIFRDSDNKKMPTIDFRDKGIGLLANEFPDSILSLNKGRKVKSLHLIGAYGQGGSTAFPASEFTIIISRKNPRGHISIQNKVALTIIRYNPGDIDVDKIGVYEYMVDKSTNLPFEIDVSIDKFECGTLVRHVEMDIGKYSGVITGPSGSLWFITHLCLFDSVYPVWIEENRSNHKRGGRVVAGNYRRLKCDANNNVKYSNSMEISIGENGGKVKITWWLLNYDDDPKKSRITNYTYQSTPVIITFNGQKHGDFSNNIIKKDLGLPYLEGYLIIHLNCDKLDNQSRRQLFASTRESVKDTTMLSELKSLLVDTLKSDDLLSGYNEERKLKFTKTTNQDIAEKIGNKVKDKLQTILKLEGYGEKEDDKESNSKRRIGGKRYSINPITVVEPPTQLEITTPDNKTIYKGKRFALSFKTNAKPECFDECNSNFQIKITSKSSCKVIGRHKVVSGYGTIHFEPEGNLKTGNKIKVTLELSTEHAVLSSSIDLIVAEKPKAKKKRIKIKMDIPNIKAYDIYSYDDYWRDENWDQYTVANVVRSPSEISVYVSMENINLKNILNRARRKGEAVEANLKNFYLEKMCFFSVFFDINLEKRSIENIDDETLEEIRKAALDSTCKTICNVMEESFDTFEIEAAATAENL